MIHLENSFSTPKVSIIVPVYNVENYLGKCLDSLVNQTLHEIEIILVNDGSTDSSKIICDEYAGKDSRIIVIHKKNNEGLLLARKTGVLLARGKYTCFVDSDDYLSSPESIQTVFDLIEKEKVDILQFSVNIFGDIPFQTEDNLRNWLKVFPYPISGSHKIIKTCLDNKYSWNLWNKIYRTEVCKQAYAQVKDVHIVIAEDLYGYFLISYYAKSFLGISTAPLYQYRYGNGSTTTQKITLPHFNNYAKAIEIVRYLHEFLDQENELQAYRKILDYLKNHLLESAIYRLMQLPESDFSDGYKLLLNCDSPLDIINVLYRNFSYREKILAEKTAHLNFSQAGNRKIKTVGIFYHRLYQGGVEKVISLQIPLFLKMGYSIVLFTDEINPDKEYPIDDSVQRVILPRIYPDDRASVLSHALSQYHVDMLLYHAASSENLLFDLLLIKSLGVSVVLTRHELTSQDMQDQSKRVGLFHQIYSLADILVVLSRMEEAYYRLMGCNAVYIPNPVEFPDPGIRSDLPKNNTILWIGRLDRRQKNYRDALRIMQRVAARHPNAKMLIVGGECTKGSVKEIQDFIHEFRLEDRIEWHDYTLDVAGYYQKAGIHLVTSSYESFPMVMIESKSFGVPLVTYSMPYLELLRDKKGYIEVPQNDIDSAADAICKLLNDENTYSSLARQAAQSLAPFKSFNQESAWEKIIDTVENRGKITLTPQHSTETENMLRLFFQTMYFHYEKGIEKKQNTSSLKILKYRILSKILVGKKKEHYRQKYLKIKTA